MSDGNYGRQYGITQLAPGPRIVEFSITSEGLKIATYGEGVKIIPEPNVRILQRFLAKFLGDQPPSVADDKVEAVIQAAREWQQQLYPTTPPITQPSISLYHAITALDPPKDPDKALVAMIDSLIHNMTLRYDSESDRIRDVISVVREHDAKTVK